MWSEKEEDEFLRFFSCLLNTPYFMEENLAIFLVATLALHFFLKYENWCQRIFLNFHLAIWTFIVLFFSQWDFENVRYGNTVVEDETMFQRRKLWRVFVWGLARWTWVRCVVKGNLYDFSSRNTALVEFFSFWDIESYELFKLKHEKMNISYRWRRYIRKGTRLIVTPWNVLYPSHLHVKTIMMYWIESSQNVSNFLTRYLNCRGKIHFGSLTPKP